jgi:hypothetical protein
MYKIKNTGTEATYSHFSPLGIERMSFYRYLMGLPVRFTTMKIGPLPQCKMTKHDIFKKVSDIIN